MFTIYNVFNTPNRSDVGVRAFAKTQHYAETRLNPKALYYISFTSYKRFCQRIQKSILPY